MPPQTVRPGPGSIYQQLTKTGRTDMHADAERAMLFETVRSRLQPCP
jgi:hypothetical protein